MKIADFDVYRDLLQEQSGQVLTQDKAYLLESRLNPVAKKWGYDHISSMTHKLRSVPERELISDIVEAMTSNDTSFFRDQKPFDQFRETILPHYASAKAPRKVRIWCAGAASGQEPYSIAMIIKEEEARLNGLTFEIVATDLSHEILEKAKEGLYSQFEVQRGLPVDMLTKYFDQDGNKWQIKDDIKNMITFKGANVLEPMEQLGVFDVIFCRNMLIDFSPLTQKDVLERMHRQLKDDGFVILGNDETAVGVTDQFRAMPDHRGLFVKSNGTHFRTNF